MRFALLKSLGVYYLTVNLSILSMRFFRKPYMFAQSQNTFNSLYEIRNIPDWLAWELVKTFNSLYEILNLVQKTIKTKYSNFQFSL